MEEGDLVSWVLVFVKLAIAFIAASFSFALLKSRSSHQHSPPDDEPPATASLSKITTTNPTPSSSSYSSFSSSSSSSEWTYDVFLSFRGADTRFGFTGNLSKALRDKGIRTFVDDQELRKGEEISPSLVNAIRNSRIIIVVFSKNYASSPFCLEELVNIMDCLNHKGSCVWPVFYEVEPSDVRHLKGRYADALAKHETRIGDKNKISKWKLALQQAADLSGWHFTDGYEYKFIESIIKEVTKKINHIHLVVADYPVGLESRVLKLKPYLESDDGVAMLGLYGIGGMGKTTLARALYNSVAEQFDGLCFLADIGDTSMKHGLVQLQEKLLSVLLGQTNIKLMNVSEGISIIKNRLYQKKILLILDDVNKLEQLKALAGGLDWFGPGSRIIITTRDQHLLHVFGVKRTYEVVELNHEDAIELFSWNAFKRKQVHMSYMDITERIIKYCNGLPLILEVIGSYLYGRTLSEWESAIDTYERIPRHDIQEILKVSYNDLEEDERKFFLDIACFFKGYPRRDVENILLNGRGFSPEYGMRVLIDKCLIKSDYLGHVTMHDLIEDMGREIVRQESPSRPGEQSRLWFSKDILDVLEDNKGSDKTEIIMLRLLKEEEVHWDGNAFKKMDNLQILVIENARFSRGPSHLPNSLRVLTWHGYPDPSLPANFNAKNLAVLDLSMSFFTLDKQPMKKLKCLTEMNLSGCQLLEQVPDMSGAPMLRRLLLDDCNNLVEVHDSVGFLSKLEYLSAKSCKSLRTLPPAFNLPSLEYLSLERCENLKSFPEITGKMENIEQLVLCFSGINELPFSIGNLVGLELLDLRECYELSELPTNVFTLPKIKVFGAEGCERINQLDKGRDQEQQTRCSIEKIVASFRFCSFTNEFFSSLFPYLHYVTDLLLDFSNITMLPTSINACHSLVKLSLNGCKELREIRGLPPNIKKLSALNCTSLTSRSKAILLSQTLHEGGGRNFVVPGSSIPNWFNHCTRGQSLCFWFHKELPAIIICVVGDMGSRSDYPKFKLSINDSEPHSFSFTGIRKPAPINHIYLSYLQLKEYYREKGWNHAEISYCTNGWPSEVNIKWMGIHVQEQHTSLIDFRFTSQAVPLPKGQVPTKSQNLAYLEFFYMDEEDTEYDYVENYFVDKAANERKSKGELNDPKSVSLSLSKLLNRKENTRSSKLRKGKEKERWCDS
ncbi:hypothetical protein RIF29_15918 [Crotalaria pallida]|uniref:TIR domain-containing protein n=1 Tax=Crotalaria pallida TaxID=3830 RepID=A0AAN9FFR2_CROPI